MTDFVKGLVDSESGNVWKFLQAGEIPGCRETPFAVFAEILRNELAALDRAFALDGVPKYLVVFGATFYENLQNLAMRI